MKNGDLVLYNGNIYEISTVDWSSLANRFKLQPLAAITFEKLGIFDNGEIYVGNSEKLELFKSNPPKYRVGDRVKYNSAYYLIRFVVVKNGTYFYQLKPEELGPSLKWAYENQIG